MTAVYNENDHGAANVLRELIANNLIAPGDVDERSIKDVRADDYRGYTQVHCFAGAGMHSGALRAAGWPDERPVGSGSCPCQGFSLAGKGLGFDDPRHLFPDWLRLIDEAREQGQPWTETLFIEQVASAGEWLDLVQLSLEDRGYAFDATDLPAAGFAQGAHIRQRFYGVADHHNAERWSDLAGRHFGDWPQTGRIEGYGQSGAGLTTGGLADGAIQRQRQEHADIGRLAERDQRAIRTTGVAGDVDWLLCRDGKIRPVEPGTFPLAATSPGRLGALRVYGNGLDFETAVNFIGAYMEACEIAAVMSEYT